MKGEFGTMNDELGIRDMEL